MRLLTSVMVAALAAVALPAHGQPDDADPAGTDQPADDDSDSAADEPDESGQAADDEPATDETEPESKPEKGPATPTDDVSPVIPTARPPREIRKWFIEGELIDPRETLEAFLSPVLDNANWTEALEEDQLQGLMASLGYHSSSRVRPMSDGGVSVVLTLEPITTVRYIVVDIKATAVERFREPIFADEIRRRMTLRPGAALERNKKDREIQLRAEADRLSRYLRNDGFYDAIVKIEERPEDTYSSRLDVKVTPGQPYTIGKITVVGNGSTPAEKVREKFRHKRWCAPLVELCIGTARFTRSQLNRDLDAVAELFQKLDYPGARVLSDFHPSHSYKPNTKTVEFTVTIRRRQKIDVVFEGNDKLSDERLKEQLTLAKDGSYDAVAIESSAEALRRYYQSKGYFEATVAGERIPFEVFDRVVFSIDRGPQLKVRRVSFSGNKAVRSGRLRDEITTREFRKIIIGEAGGYATTTQLLQDARRIKDLYAKRGFPDAQVDLRVSRSARADANAAALAAAVASGSKADGLYVHFHVREGDFLMVDSTRVTSNDKLSFPADKLLAVGNLKPGKPFRESSVDADVRRIRQFYLQKGFPRAKIEPSWKRTGSKVEITYAIQEGQPATIGKVLIRGNYKTSDWVIRDEMGLDEGEPLTLDGTDRAQANLRRSGLFSSVNINYVEIDDPRTPNVNVLVNVEESRDLPAIVNFGGGYSTDSRFFAETGVTLPNLFGIGADFDLRGQLGQEIQSIQGTVTLPRWIMRRALGTAFSWNLNGFWRNQLTERFGELESYGGSIAATRQVTRGFFDGWLFSVRYDFRRRNRDEELVRPTGQSDDIIQSPVSTSISAIGPVVIVDRRVDAQGQRNPLAPANGYRLELRSSFAEDFTPLGSNSFIKIGTSGQYFISFARRFRLSNAVRYDHGIPLGGDVLLPEVERFFAGGDVTVRGFEEDRLGTEVITQSVPPATGVQQLRVLPAGGNIRFIYNLELEVIAYRWTALSLASAVFFDTGLITNSLDGFQVTDLRHSLGVALARLVTPFGSLSAEWAVPLDPQLGDNPRGRAHFNFGFLF